MYIPDQQPNQQRDAPLTITADPKDLIGRYANAFSVTSQERDVVIDFLSHVNVNGNGQHQTQLVSRIFLNRFTAQDLVVSLKKNLENWETMRYERTYEVGQSDSGFMPKSPLSETEGLE
jgi:hypothetical protein